jgi:hypothetical protein
MKHVAFGCLINTNEAALHNKILHKTQSHWSPSFVFAYVLDRS